MIFETRYLPSGINGIALILFGLIRSDLREPLKAAVIAHERVHLRQQWRYLVIGFLALYFFKTTWGRLRLEAEAYAQDVKLGRERDEVVRILARTCDVSRYEADAALRRWL